MDKPQEDGYAVIDLIVQFYPDAKGLTVPFRRVDTINLTAIGVDIRWLDFTSEKTHQVIPPRLQVIPWQNVISYIEHPNSDDYKALKQAWDEQEHKKHEDKATDPNCMICLATDLTINGPGAVFQVYPNSDEDGR